MLKRRIVMVIAGSALLLGACGKTDEKKPVSQVAAKVNGDEISVHQINNAVMRMGAPAGNPAQAGRQVLERLIDQQLLVQKAAEAKLDRDANVMTAIENARRQILSQAYMERTVGEPQRPTAEDIRKYYDEHADIFGKRRIYRFQEMWVQTDREDQAKALQEQLKKTTSLADIYGWLRANNYPFQTTSTIKASEQLSRELLQRLQSLKANDILYFPVGQRALAVQVLSWQEVPLSEAEAKPFIEQILMTQRRSDQAAAEIKRLRTAARVDYVGEYAEAPAAAKADTPAPAAADATGNGKDAASTGQTDAAGGFIDRGLTGLK